MSESLDKKIKVETGYTESVSPKCSHCKYSKSIENKHVDRQWDTKCYIVELVTVIDVSSEGRCDKFDDRI